MCEDDLTKQTQFSNDKCSLTYVKNDQYLMKTTLLSPQLLGINIMLILIGMYLALVQIWFIYFNADISNFNMWVKLVKL